MFIRCCSITADHRRAEARELNWPTAECCVWLPSSLARHDVSSCYERGEQPTIGAHLALATTSFVRFSASCHLASVSSHKNACASCHDVTRRAAPHDFSSDAGYQEPAVICLQCVLRREREPQSKRASPGLPDLHLALHASGTHVRGGFWCGSSG